MILGKSNVRIRTALFLRQMIKSLLSEVFLSLGVSIFLSLQKYRLILIFKYLMMVVPLIYKFFLHITLASSFVVVSEDYGGLVSTIIILQMRVGEID